MTEIKKTKGFTLVEVIVVMVIIAILAALMVPSLTKYIDKAHQNALVNEGHLWFVAAQTAASENYGKNNKSFREAYKNTTTYYNVPVVDESGKEKIVKTKAIRISNYLFYNMQGMGDINTKNIEKKVGKDTKGMHYKAFLAADILNYNECLNDKSVYDFSSDAVLGGSSSTATAEGYFNANPRADVALNVYIDEKGRVVMLQYAKRGYDQVIQYTTTGFKMLDSVNTTANGK